MDTFILKLLNASGRGGMRNTMEKEFPAERNREVKDENYNDSSNRNVVNVYS